MQDTVHCDKVCNVQDAWSEKACGQMVVTTLSTVQGSGGSGKEASVW